LADDLFAKPKLLSDGCGFMQISPDGRWLANDLGVQWDLDTAGPIPKSGDSEWIVG